MEHASTLTTQEVLESKAVLPEEFFDFATRVKLALVDQEMYEVCDIPPSELRLAREDSIDWAYEVEPDSVYAKMTMHLQSIGVNAVTIQKNYPDSKDANGRRTARNHVILALAQ